jgi:DNA replication protein DnaC
MAARRPEPDHRRPHGVGKTWLACALAHKACRDGNSVGYLRLPRLLEDLGMAHGDGRFTKLMANYAKTDLLILDLCCAPRYVE